MAQDSDPALLTAELRARAEHARGPYDQAVWRLLLGEPEAGLEAIRHALPGLTADVASQPSIGLHAAHLALIANDDAAPRLAQAAIDHVLVKYVAGEREYQATILALIAGDDGQAAPIQERLDAYVASHGSMRGGHPSAIADVPRGLLARDAVGTAAGVSALLAWHLRRARAPSDDFNSSRGVISLDAIVALIVAHRRGLDTPVAPEYRAASLPMLLLHVTEWAGRPLPRAMPIQATTDLVAGPWLRSHGLSIEDPPQPSGTPPARAMKRPAHGPAVSGPEEQAAAREALAARVRGAGSAWQLASWSLMLGDVAGARGHLQAKAAEARRQWQASAPPQGGLSRLFSKDQALPNQNYVREHFGLALVLSD